jgi:uncharacterized protein YndB with AHSA1/START domain
MSHAQAVTPLTLVMNRTFKAPREAVFRAWIDATALSKWFAPQEDFKVNATVDAQVGGAYSIHMHAPDGKEFSVSGIYRQITPPSLLQFTWEGGCSKGEPWDSLVTIEFLEVGDQTEIRLRHEGLPNEEERGKHEHGWVGCLAQLQKFVG